MGQLALPPTGLPAAAFAITNGKTQRSISTLTKPAKARYKPRVTSEQHASSATSAQPLPFFPDKRLVEEVPLPCLLDCKHFVNLTNGLEVLPQLQRLGLPVSFVRIQSTACEQQLFEKLLAELDSDLLLYLALGHCCLVYDLGSRNKKRGAPRALWYGLEFVKYALTRLLTHARSAPSRVWLPGSPPPEAFLRGYRVTDAFEGRVRSLGKSTKKRLRYFAKYMLPGGLPAIRLYGVYRATHHDDDFQYYRTIAQGALAPGDWRPPAKQVNLSSSCRPVVTAAEVMTPAAALAVAAAAPVAVPPPLAATRGAAAAAATATAVPEGEATAAAAAPAGEALAAEAEAAAAAASMPGVAYLQTDATVQPSNAARPEAVSSWGAGRASQDLTSPPQGGLDGDALAYAGAAATQPWANVLDRERTVALLAGNAHQAVEELLGMRLLLGGIDHAVHEGWKQSMEHSM
ncbi:hypothetical protein N2152v2_003255 [Parachlorella kessleri]